MNQKFTLTLPYHPSYSIDKIKSKINEILSKIPIKNIILGCDANTTYAKDVIDYFHEHHIRVYLRLPILCGNTKDRIPMIDMEQKQTARACPSSLHNAHEIIHLYETSFANLPFDGVFLDELQSASFVSSYAQGFGCFCDSCEKQMYSLDLPYIKDLIQRHDKNLLRGEYDKYGRYHFADYQVNMFYKRKAQIISDLIFKLSAYFNSRKLIVGVNVLAPVMAYHASQNINEIGKLVDFVQPMMFTKGCNGMSKEYDAYLQYFEEGHHFSKHALEGLLSEKSMRRQLDYLSNINANVIPSIEIQTENDHDQISVDEVLEQLHMFHSYATLALCGDLMKIDDAILTLISNALLVS